MSLPVKLIYSISYDTMNLPPANCKNSKSGSESESAQTATTVLEQQPEVNIDPESKDWLACGLGGLSPGQQPEGESESGPGPSLVLLVDSTLLPVASLMIRHPTGAHWTRTIVVLRSRSPGSLSVLGPGPESPTRTQIRP